MGHRKLLRYSAIPVLVLLYSFTLVHLDAGGPHKDRFPYEMGLTLFIYLGLYSFWKKWAERYADKRNWKKE